MQTALRYMGRQRRNEKQFLDLINIFSLSLVRFSHFIVCVGLKCYFDFELMNALVQFSQ